jgi:hypothetical protein
MASNIISTTPAPLTELARNAGALGDIFSLLVGISNNNADAQSFIQNNIPNFSAPIEKSSPYTNLTNNQEPTHNLPIALLLFVNALKNGNFREWLGRSNAKWLEDNGYENLLKKAEGEFSSLARQFVETPPNGQWQSLFFPIAVEGGLQQARLFVKRDRKEQETSNGSTSEEDTRFVLEMDLSNLGQMQMDGFVRRSNNETGAQKTQFDLIIRSHNQLSSKIKNDVMQIYNSTGELTGYSGSLNFQTIKDFPVNPMEELMTGEHKQILA